MVRVNSAITRIDGKYNTIEHGRIEQIETEKDRSEQNKTGVHVWQSRTGSEQKK